MSTSFLLALIFLLVGPIHATGEFGKDFDSSPFPQWQLKFPCPLGPKAYVDVKLHPGFPIHAFQFQAILDEQGENMTVATNASPHFLQQSKGDLAIVSVYDGTGHLAHTYRVHAGGGVVIVVLSDD